MFNIGSTDQGEPYYGLQLMHHYAAKAQELSGLHETLCMQIHPPSRPPIHDRITKILSYPLGTPPPPRGIKLVHPNRCLSRTNALRWGRLTVSATRRFGEKKRGGRTLKRVLTIRGRSSTLGSPLAANQVRGCPGLMTAAALARGEHGAPGLIPRGSLAILLVAVAYPVRRGPRSYWFVSFHSGSLLYSLCLGRAWPRKAQSRGEGGIDYEGGISSCQDLPGIHLCASDINIYIHVAISTHFLFIYRFPSAYNL